MATDATNTTTTEPTAPVTTPAPAAEPGTTTQPQAENADMDAIIRAAAQKAEEAASKKMPAVFKSVLLQQGFDTDTIAKMTAEWKSQQTTPEDTIAELKTQKEASDKRADALEKRFQIVEKGIPADQADKYAKLAAVYMDDETDFAAALDKALADFPVKHTTPTIVLPSSGGTVGTDDEFQKRLDKYKKK